MSGIKVTQPTKEQLAEMPLLASIQYFEPKPASAINKIMNGLFPDSIYKNFTVTPVAGKLVVTIKAAGGLALVKTDNNELIKVEGQHDVNKGLGTGTNYIYLVANFAHDTITKQVDLDSAINPADFIVTKSPIGNGLLIAKVTVPSGASAVNNGMISYSGVKRFSFDDFAKQVDFLSHNHDGRYLPISGHAVSAENANKLDGLDSTTFARLDRDIITQANEIGVSNSKVAIIANDGQGNANVTFNHANGIPAADGNAGRIEFNTDSSENPEFHFELRAGVKEGEYTSLANALIIGSNKFLYEGKKVWHEGSDGAGSGLDADKLDGQHGSYYAKASQVLTNVPANAKFTDTQRPIADTLTNQSVATALSAKQGYVLKGMIDQLQSLVLSDDTTLDNIQEIVDFIKQNKDTLDTLAISNIAGLQAALDTKFDKSSAINYAHKNSENTFTKTQRINTEGTALIVGGTSLQSGKDVSVYFGATYPSAAPLGFHLTYEGSGVGNKNAFVLSSTNQGAPKEILRSNQDGIASLPQLGANVAGHVIYHTGNDGAGSGLDADKLDGQHGSYYAKASQVLTNVPAGAVFTDTQRAITSSVNSLHTTTSASAKAVKTAYDKGVEALNKANTKLGATAKAVDSDKLDGLDSTKFVRTDTNSNLNGVLTIQGEGDTRGLRFFQGNDAAGVRFRNAENDNGEMEFWTADNGTEPFVFKTYHNGVDGTGSSSEWFRISNDGATVKGKKVWHEGNDGAGSGLDADKLGGVSSSLYTRKNLDIKTSAGTVSAASDKVAISANDGFGNANVTFNHAGGSPAINGHSGRIQVNTDAAESDARFVFELGQYTKAGTTAALSEVLYISANSFKYKGSVIYHSGNDGAGSGLDADKLDGLHANQFLRADAPNYSIRFGGDGVGNYDGVTYDDNSNVFTFYADQTKGGDDSLFRIAGTGSKEGITFKNKKVWHEGNDGAGSGLDADKLDGQHGSFYAKASQVLTNVPANAKFTDTQRAITSVVNSTATGTSASAKAVKTAYDKGVEALNKANTKLGATATAVDSDKLGGIDSSDFVRKSTNNVLGGNNEFTGRDVPLKANAIVLNNTENDAVSYTENNGLLAFDENFYDDNGYGTGAYSPSGTFGDNGGGLLIRNEDGWGALLSSQNTRFADSQFRGLKVGNSRVWHAGNVGANSGLDADKLDGQHGSYYAKASQVLTNVPANAKFTDTHRSISDSVSSTATGTSASSKAVKKAYDRGSEALSKANTKLDKTAKAADSDKLDGRDSAHFVSGTTISKTTGVTDWDNIYESGFFDGNDAVNAPFEGWAWGINFAHRFNGAGEEGNKYGGQIAVNNTGTDNGNKLAFRARRGSGEGKWHEVWHTGNDGAGSGLDADKLDGQEGSYYAKASQVLTNVPANAKFTDTHRSISDSVSSTATGTSASSKAVKTAYDKGVEALNKANTKLGATAKAADSDKLDGHNSTTFARLDKDIITSATATGSGSGKVAITTNDGHGHANLTFNHVAGRPMQDGNSLRIESNVDSTVSPEFTFEVAQGVKAGVAVTLSPVMNLGLDKFKYKGHNIFHAGNMGVGSGLDAEKFAGLDLSKFVRVNNANGSIQFGSNFDGNYDGIVYNESFNSFSFYSDQARDAVDPLFRVGGAGEHNSITYKGNNVWHEGNDGAGSGLDADKLDGQHGSYYAKASQVLTNVPANAKFTDTQRAITSSVNSLHTTTSASAKAVKTAYDKGVEALNKANTKLGATAKAVDSDKLGGVSSNLFVRNDQDLATSAAVVSSGDGKTALTSNDGYGNANFTFNHVAGRPMVSGNSARIDVNVDNASEEPRFLFGIKQNTVAGELATLDNLLYLSKTRFNFDGHAIWHAGNDGEGSSLDADKLDGQHGSYYAKASQVLTNVPAGAKFTDTNTHRAISDSVTSLNTTTSASSKAVKTAYDRGSEALSRANTKLDKAAKAADSDKLDGLSVNNFVYGSNATATEQTQNSGDLYRSTFFNVLDGNDAPAQGWLWGVNLGHVGNSEGGNKYGAQIVFENSSTTPKMHIRAKNAGGAGGWAKVWHDKNDGSGSGLDADKLDGYQASDFARTGTTTPPSTYLYTYRDSGNPAFYATQGGTGDIAKFLAASKGATESSKSVVITNEGGVVSTGDNIALSMRVPNPTDRASNVSLEWVSDKPRLRVGGSGASSSSSFSIQSVGDTNFLEVGSTQAYVGHSKHKVWHAGNDGSGSGLDADKLDGYQASDFLGKNSTAANSAKLDNRTLSTSANGTTIPLRDSSGDMYARLFRSTYPNQTTISGAIAYRNSTTDNYIRFCSSTSAIRSWLNVYSKQEVLNLTGGAWTVLRDGADLSSYTSPISLAGKEVCFVSTDDSSTDQINVAKCYIPPVTGFTSDCNFYVPIGEGHIQYDYSTREVRSYGDYENHQIWYRTPAQNDYPPMGTINKSRIY